MAYYKARPEDAQNAPATPQVQYPGPVDIWDTMRAPLAGLWEGLAGKNRTWEQYMYDKKGKKRGRAPGQYPGRGPVNWLRRTITGK